MIFRRCFHLGAFERDPLFLELVENLHGDRRYIIINTLHRLYGVARDVIEAAARNYRG